MIYFALNVINISLYLLDVKIRCREISAQFLFGSMLKIFYQRIAGWCDRTKKQQVFFRLTAFFKSLLFLFVMFGLLIKMLGVVLSPVRKANLKFERQRLLTQGLRERPDSSPILLQLRYRGTAVFAVPGREWRRRHSSRASRCRLKRRCIF